MKKNSEQLKKRKEFIKEAMNDPKKASNILRRKSYGLANCRTTTDIVYALQDILFMSEGTIFNDLKH